MFRRLLGVALVASVLAVPAVDATEAACPQSVLTVRGSNPSYAVIGGLLASQAKAHGIPPQVLKAIAYRESTWRQFRADGRPVISSDSVCGIGLMQVTLGSRSDGARLASDVAYNVDEGAKILKAKWNELQNQTHPAPTGYPLDDPNVIENWYTAICRYNGCSGAGADKVYALPVSELIARPFQLGLPHAILAHMPGAGFTTPADADPTWEYPHGFQAQHDPDQFVFFEPSTGAVTKIVPAKTHLGSTAFPGYGAGGYGPYGPNVSCAQCAAWRPAEGFGIAGWAHWTNSVTGADLAKVTWIPARTGQFDVKAYVPALVEPLAPAVTYHLGSATQTIDQNAAKGTWVSLGRRTLSAASPVWVGDHSTVGGVKIAADALRLTVVTKLELLRSASAVSYGSPVRLTMRLSQVGGAGVTGRTVVLAKRAVGATAWTNVGAYKTAADGRVAINATPAVNTDYRLTYAATDTATTSAPQVIRRVLVKPVVRASLSRTSAPRNTAVRVSATVSPSHAGQPIVLQQYISGAWRGVAGANLGSTSAASWTFAKSAAGTYKYRVYKAADADHAASVSPTLTLTVT